MRKQFKINGVTLIKKRAILTSRLCKGCYFGTNSIPCGIPKDQHCYTSSNGKLRDETRFYIFVEKK